MAKFTRWLLKYRYIVLGVLILLLALSVVGSMLVDKESDVLSYLDKDSDTVKGKEILNQEFSIVGDCTIGLSFLTKDEVAGIITKFEESDKIGKMKVEENGETVDLLSKLVWMGTFDALYQLENYIDVDPMMQLLQNKFQVNTDGIDTFVVNLYFVRSGSDNAVIDALDEAENIIRETYDAKIKAGELNTTVDNCYFIGGMAQNARVLVDSSVNDMPKFVAAAVVCVFVILLVSTNSYLEPVIFLATLGISILLNMGNGHDIYDNLFVFVNSSAGDLDGLLDIPDAHLLRRKTLGKRSERSSYIGYAQNAEIHPGKRADDHRRFRSAVLHDLRHGLRPWLRTC